MIRPAALPGRRRRPALRRLGFSLAGILLGLLLTSPASLAVPSNGIAIPQQTRVERFNPDLQVCQPQAIKDGFARQLQPWADQPPAVLAQLRRVQLEMTQATLRRCVSNGLLQAAEAAELERQLGLQAATSPSPSQGAGVAPAVAPSGRP